MSAVRNSILALALVLFGVTLGVSPAAANSVACSRFFAVAPSGLDSVESVTVDARIEQLRASLQAGAVPVSAIIAFFDGLVVAPEDRARGGFAAAIEDAGLTSIEFGGRFRLQIMNRHTATVPYLTADKLNRLYLADYADSFASLLVRAKARSLNFEFRPHIYARQMSAFAARVERLAFQAVKSLDASALPRFRGRGFAIRQFFSLAIPILPIPSTDEIFWANRARAERFASNPAPFYGPEGDRARWARTGVHWAVSRAITAVRVAMLVAGVAGGYLMYTQAEMWSRADIDFSRLGNDIAGDFERMDMRAEMVALLERARNDLERSTDELLNATATQDRALIEERITRLQTRVQRYLRDIATYDAQMAGQPLAPVEAR